MRKMIYLALCAAIVTGISCNKKDTTTTPTPVAVPKARVMYMNFGTGLGSLYIKTNDTALSAAADIAYQTAKGYVDVSVGSIKSAFFQTSGNSLLLDTTMSLSANAHYTIAMAGTASPTAPAVIVATTDDLTAPATGKARVRLINLNTNDYNEALYVDTTAAISGIHYKGASSFTDVPAGTYAISIFDPAHASLQKQVTQNYVAGKIYTFVLAGRYASSTDNTTALTVIGNN